MRDFFKPWRRKIGVLMLMMACVLMAGWVRSNHFADLVWVKIDSRTRDEFVSCPSGLGWVRRQHRSEATANSAGPMRGIQWFISANKDRPKLGKLVRSIWGFQYASPNSEPRMWGVFIHYQVVVIPLTMLSAYLLLSKPRVAKSKAAGEMPVPEQPPV